MAFIFNAVVVRADSGSSEIRVRDVPLELSGSLPLDGYIDVALVQDSSVTLQDMLGQPILFSPIARHDINLGFVQTSAWMRFALAPSPQAKHPQNLLLSLTPNFTDELEVYVGLQGKSKNTYDFNRYEMGDHSPRSQVHFNTSANILPLELQPGETTVVYIRARNQDASLNVSAELLSPSDYEYRSIVQNIVRGMWFGGMGILLVIQFLFFYFDRKSFYFFLALDILAVSSTYFGSLGLARLLFFSEGGLGNDYLTSSSSWLGLAAGALSIAGILELRHRYPRLDLYCRFAAITGFVGVTCVFAGVNRYFVTVAGPVILVLTTLAVIVAFLDFHRSRDAQQGLNFAAFGLLWAGLIVTNSQRYGILPLPGWVASSYAATSIMHFTLLTGSLAVRLRKAEAATREADRRALLAANAAEHRANDLVRERTQELEAAKRVAEVALYAELQAQEQQVRFMEVISHQYRTPLGVIRTNLESIRLTLPKSDGSNRERLNRANGGIMRLVEVLEVNLTRSKIQGPSYQPNLVDTSVADLTEAALSNASDLLPGTKINLAVSVEGRRACILADKEMLRLAIINLLENAAKFSAPLGSAKVEVAVFCVRDEVHLKITDDGIGIQDGQINDLVKHSVRGSNSAHVEGKGIGLSLVKRAVDAHGGQFLIRNRSEGGAEATIVLPKFNRLAD
jgi:signal transduction histidine kinase